MEDNFIKASRIKLRWETSQGALGVEELWDLSLQSLDTLARKVNKILRDEGEESFIPTTNSRTATYNDLRLDILKHVIGVKVEESEARKDRAARLAQLARMKE